MREGGKKTFKKKNIEHILGQVNDGDQIKKNIGHISGKVLLIIRHMIHATIVDISALAL